ncbi:TolC family protein [Halosquirtibacter laminarini]|uniref:TolC family protein n=1 Tax=Halosquirtibacter laminarini TaxID=3374600 RepID=A0AC61NPE8_9BACT|nr:TolC family protein [Prolixibacteraceae bacterium]
MKIKEKYVLGLILFMGTVHTKAQLTISRDICRDRVLHHSEEISMANRELKSAKYYQKEMRTLFLPKASIRGRVTHAFSDVSKLEWDNTYLPTAKLDPTSQTMVPNVMLDMHGKPVIGADGNPIFDQYAFLPSGGISYDMNESFGVDMVANMPLYGGGKIRLANEMADLGVDIYQLKRKETQEQLLLASDECYWSYVAAHEQVEVSAMYLSLLDSLTAKVENAVSVGLKHRNELLKVEVKRNSAQIKLQEAKNQRDLLRMSLCRLMGLPLSISLMIDDSTKVVVSPMVLDQKVDVSSRSDYKILSKRDQMKKLNEKLVVADYLPAIGIKAGARYLKALHVDNMGTTPFVQEGWIQNNITPTVAVEFSIPIPYSGERRNKRMKARMASEIAQLETQKKSRLMELEAMQAKQKIQQAYDRYLLYKKSLVQAKLNMDMSKEAYMQGLELITDYLEAQLSWQQQYSLFVYSKSQYKIEQVKYQKAMGVLSSVWDSLQQE